jgi:hypothetical protein
MQNKLYEIVHGSENSLDRDVYWVMKKLPSKEELISINKSINTSDINFITIHNGIVSDCIKGVVDEINNGIIDTFHLHPQSLDYCPVFYRQHRDSFVKTIRFIRGILVQFSKTDFRPIVKKASKSHNLKLKIDTAIELISHLDKIDDFVRLNKTDLFKFLSFQLAQSKALFDNIEIYTKNSAKLYLHPTLSTFIDRQVFQEKDIQILQSELISFLAFFKDYCFKTLYLQQVQTMVVNKDFTFDLKYEFYLE